MKNSSEFVRWDIWIAKVGFEEESGCKIRPVLIIDDINYCVLSLKITSHPPRNRNVGEYQILDWKNAGLLKPSTVRISKLLRLPHDSFVKKIGKLMPLDCNNISRIYYSLYSKGLIEQ